MKTLYLFRSNIKHLEYYHSIIDIDEFERNCHDFYLLMPLEFLKMGLFDKVYIIRVHHRKRETITFKVKNNKGTKGLFHQIFLKDFNDVFKLPDKPDITIFRGGFKEYDNLVKYNKSFFGTTFYLGASRRFHPQFGGEYDYILYESELDLIKNKNDKFIYKRFFKTANPKIFYPIDNIRKEFDIIWPWKYTSDHRKGEKFFLQAISQHDGLKKLKIYHCGNEPKKAQKLFNSYGVSNITCDDIKHYHEMVDIYNMGYCGLITSDKEDGCPRQSTEILSCATPLVIRNKTRILSYYKGHGFLEYYDAYSLYNKIIYAIKNYNKINMLLKDRLHNDLSIRKICKMNAIEWNLI